MDLPLHLAAAEGHHQTVQTLIKLGAGTPPPLQPSSVDPFFLLSERLTPQALPLPCPPSSTRLQALGALVPEKNHRMKGHYVLNAYTGTFFFFDLLCFRF